MFIVNLNITSNEGEKRRFLLSAKQKALLFAGIMSAQTSDPAADAQPNSVEMEETVARIRTHKGVEAVIIMDRRGASGLIFVLQLVRELCW